MTQTANARAGAPKAPTPHDDDRVVTLSGRLLRMTIIFVLIAEVLVYIPSLANFRHNWLIERANKAQIAALAYEAGGGLELGEEQKRELLERAGAFVVTLLRDGMREELLRGDIPAGRPLAREDLDRKNDFYLVYRAFETWLAPDDRLLLITITTSAAGEYGPDGIEILISELELKHAMAQFTLRIIGLSLFISVIVGGLVYFFAYRQFVQPINGLIGSMIAFRESPQDASRIYKIEPSESVSELAQAGQALAEMQSQVRNALQQKNRLAALGTAVSKINHDLRNILASAQLVTDRLAKSDDPTVSRLAPKLVRSIDRAVALCERTLRFGRADEPDPQRERLPLAPLVQEVRSNIDPLTGKKIHWETEIPEKLEIDADPEQLFRILLNITRNSVQAMQAMADADTKLKIRLSAERIGDAVHIEIADTGPGIPEKARDKLFQPFVSSSGPDGTGLGLAIVAELVEAHGGAIRLVQTSPEGTVFRIEISDTVQSA